MQFSIIIPFYKESPLSLESTVKSIRKTQDYHHQIILVDDGNSDKIHGNLIEKYGCEYYKNEKNLGVGPSRQIGASKAAHNNLAFFDAHVIVGEEWDIDALKLLNDNPTCILSPYVKPTNVDVEGTFGGAWCRTSKDKWLDLELAAKPSTNMPCCYGGAFFIKKPWFDYLRGFDGLLQHGMEEQFLSLKSYAAGGGVIVGEPTIYQELRKTRAKDRILSNSLNRLFISRLFNQEYEDEFAKDIEHLLHKDKISELAPYFDKILSKSRIEKWIKSNSLIEAQIKPANQ